MGTTLVHFAVRPFPHTRVIGKSVFQKLESDIADPTITDLWQRMAADGSIDALLRLPGRVGPGGDTVGWMGDVQPEEGHFTYLAGALFEPGTPAPEGYISRDIVACDMAVAWLRATDDPEGGDLFANASENMGRAMRANGYEYDDTRGGFEMEYYSAERFRAARERGEQPTLDFYSPCRRSRA